MRVLIAVGLAWTSACYEPIDPDETEFKCDQQKLCPEGYFCSSVQSDAFGESASLFRSHHVPWFLRSRRNVGSSMSLQLHSALNVVIDSGARGRS